MQNAAKVSDRPYVRLATQEDALDLGRRLRKEDELEVLYASGLAPEVALRFELQVSKEAHAVIWKGRVVALFGLVESMDWEDGGREAFPWMLASDELKDIRKSFLRQCRGYVKGWLKDHPVLSGYAWAKNQVHLQWLRWLGFQLDDPKPLGPYGQPFQKFHLKAEYVS